MTVCDAVPELLSDEVSLTAFHLTKLSMKRILKCQLQCLANDWHLGTSTQGQDMCASASDDDSKT